MTSLETNEALIPSWPIEIPSDTAIVEKINAAESGPFTPFFAYYYVSQKNNNRLIRWIMF